MILITCLIGELTGPGPAAGPCGTAFCRTAFCGTARLVPARAGVSPSVPAARATPAPRAIHPFTGRRFTAHLRPDVQSVTCLHFMILVRKFYTPKARGTYSGPRTAGALVNGRSRRRPGAGAGRWAARGARRGAGRVKERCGAGHPATMLRNGQPCASARGGDMRFAAVKPSWIDDMTVNSVV